jgi:hypothetical protein
MKRVNVPEKMAGLSHIAALKLFLLELKAGTVLLNVVRCQ